MVVEFGRLGNILRRRAVVSDRFVLACIVALTTSVPSSWAVGASEATDASANGGGALFLLLAAAALVVYLLPWIVAKKRGVASSGALFFVNLLFGWTLIAWLACFIWAGTGATKAQDEYFRAKARSAR